MLKRKPIIISAGCSFTNPNFWSHCPHLPDKERGGWPIWTDHFTTKLEKHYGKKYKLIHTGESGGSLDFALDNIINQISLHQDRIDYVLWGGTDFCRWMDMFTLRRINPMYTLRNAEPIKDDNAIVTANVLDVDAHFGALGNALLIKWFSNKNGKTNVLRIQLQKLWTVLKLCEQYNITLLYYQLLEPLYGINYLEREWKRIFGSNEYDQLSLDLHADQKWEMNVASTFPFFSDLLRHKEHFYGLLHLDPDAQHWSWAVRNDNIEFDLIVCPPKEMPMKVFDNTAFDYHPNAQGHKDIAKRLWTHYEANFI